MNEALGLGGAKLKAVLSEINNMSGDPTASAIYGKLLKQGG